VLIAAARYLAAHAPTVRAQEQTYQIARRLNRGERIFEEESDPDEVGTSSATERRSDEGRQAV
ncbi:MAG: hypothetical protein IH804_08540, partial [Planctomycetes bacterium]|nr:hypothetical protein [Planctomycetota bacterium]